MTAVVALLMLCFADEHFNDARYTRAATAIFVSNSEVVRIAAMEQRIPDPAEETLLRTLERLYAHCASRIFKANRIPEPERLPEPKRPETPARTHTQPAGRIPLGCKRR
jgi:hypothetical protein